MKKALRIISLLLALVTVLALVAACGETGNNGDNTTTAKAEQTNSEKFDARNYIPADNLQDYDFRILVPQHDWAITDMVGEEISGDLIMDAIYDRQLAVEEHLKVKLSQEKTGSDVASRLQTTAAQSGDDAYDLAEVPTDKALTLFLGGYVADQNKISTMHLDQPWYEHGFNSQVNLKGKRYITFGNASLIYYSSFYIYCFNKEMITSYSLENPYDLVTTGDWTWDKAYEMMKVVATDNDQDGLSTPGVDTLGLVGHINHSRNLMFSSGYTICEQDAAGNITFNGLSENYINAYTKYLNYFINDYRVAISGMSKSRYTGYNGSEGLKNYISVFVNGEALFLTTGTNEVTTIRETQHEYGVVVVPKASKEQQNYITPVYSATAGFVVPVATGDVERSGKVLEALNGFSYSNLIDKHISIVLHYRVANDPTAISMINKAYESGAIDVAMANNFGSCTGLLNNLHMAGSDGISTMFNSVKSAIQKDLKTKMEQLEAAN